MKFLSKISAITSLFLVLLFTPFTVQAAEITSNWFQTTNLPYQLASHTAFGDSNKLYVVDGSALTGASHDEIIHSTQNSDGTLGAWSSSANTPTALIFHAQVINSSKVYILGGREENAGSALNHVNKVFFADKSNLSNWQQTTSLPNNFSMGAAAVSGNYMFFAGGFNTSGVKNSVYSALINPDGTLGSWTTVNSLPHSAYGHGLIEHNGYLYMIGGYNGAYHGEVYRAKVNNDGTISSWTQDASFSQGVYRAGFIKVKDMIIVVSGAYSDSGLSKKVYFTQIQEDGTLLPWTESANQLPEGMTGAGIAQVGKYLYVTGGFRSGAGYLNSVYATKLNLEPNLSVPLLKQTDSAWGTQIYNAANTWSPSSPGISSWGCALTSAAMVFNYHGITKLPNGQVLNPGTLNTWLKSQSDGYVGTGWVNWLALSRLSTVSKTQNPGFTFGGLEYSRKSGFANTVLFSDLENNIPGILEVAGGPGGQHFVVGKGLEDAKILINDPYYSRENLSEYGNTFKTLGRFIPSNTDLSYIFLTAPEGITLSIKDENGNTVGEGFLQEALDNDEGDGKNTPLVMYYVQKPTGGNYIVSISSDTTKQYELKQYVYDANGEVKIVTKVGVVGSGITDTFKISYNKESISQSNSTQEVTFASFIADLDLLYAQGKISNLGVYVTLKQNTQLAEMFKNMGNKTHAKALLTTVMGQIDFQRKKLITEGAYQILKPQIQLLISSL